MKPVILFSTDSLSRGGKERQIILLTTYLLRKDYSVMLLTKMSDKRNSYYGEYYINEKLIKTYRDFNEYKNHIIEIRPDIIISWDTTSSFYNLLLYYKFKFIFINGSIRHGIRLLKFSHIFRSIVCHLSPYVIANSYAGLRANNLRIGQRRFVLKNGVETKFKNEFSRYKVAELREKLIPGYNLDPGCIYISVANFVAFKDYSTVFKALAKFNRFEVFYYIIIGDGPMREKIQKTIQKFHLEKRVIIVGMVDNVRDYLFASDIMIHSSKGEGISNAILEAMYAGLPLIATNVGGIRETVYPDSCMLFPYKDHQALYNCLLKSHEFKSSFDPELYDYQTHLEEFSVSTMVKRFEEIIGIIMESERNTKTMINR